MAPLKMNNILNEDEQERLRKYGAKSWGSFYQDNNEQSLYKTATALRKENYLQATNFKPNKPDTYKQLIINKPKENSIGDSVFKFINGVQKVTSTPKLKLPFDREEDSNLNKGIDLFKQGTVLGGIKTIEATKPYVAPVLRTTARVLDKADDIILKQNVARGTTIGGIGYYNVKELVNSFKEDRDFNFGKVVKDVDGLKTRTEYFLGTNINKGGYLDFSTAEEKRKAIYEKADTSTKMDLDNIGKYTLIPDIIAGITTGVASGGMFSSAIKTAGKTTLTGRVLNTLDKTINPSLNNMAKFGAGVGALTIPYYGMTGKWLFEDDAVATEGAMIFLGSLGIKGLGEGGKFTTKQVKDIFSDVDVKKGYSDFIENFKTTIEPKVNKFANFTGVKLNIIEDSKPLDFTNKTEIKKLRNLLISTQQQQGIKGGYNPDIEELRKAGIPGYDNIDNTLKIDTINQSRESGIIKFTGVDSKGEAQFEWTQKGLDSKLPTPGKGLHFPVKEWVKLTGEDLTRGLEIPSIKVDPIKEIKDDAIIDAKIKADIEYERKINKLKTQERTIETKAKDLGMWDDKKSYIDNYSSFIWNRGKSYIWKNEDKILGRKAGDKGVDLKLNKADRTIERKLASTKLFGKIERINEEFGNIGKDIGNDIEGFNNYLFQKSRYYKTISENMKGNELKTIGKNADGSTFNWTKDELKKAWSKVDSKYKILADRVHNLNKEVLQAEVEAGVRTQDEMNNFLKNNPFYIPDNLEIEGIDRLVKAGDFNIKNVKIQKGLVGGSENNVFSKNSMFNLSKSLAYRMRVASNSKTINTLLQISEDTGSDIARLVEGGKGGKRGYSTVSTYINGERKLVDIPTFYKEALESNDIKTITTLEKILRKPTTILKGYATGPLNLVFQAKAPFYETTFGLLKNWTNGGNIGDYFKSMLRSKDSFMNTAEGKLAMRALIKNSGGDFSGASHLMSEFDGLVKNSLGENPFNEKGILRKGYNKLSGVAHEIEQRTTRIPVFESQLKKYGISTKEWNDITKKFVIQAGNTDRYIVDTNGLKKALEAKGIDVNNAGLIAREIFDYNASSNGIKRIAQIIPYFDIPFNSVKAMSDAFQDNPKKFITYLGAMVGIAEGMYLYNYSGEKGDKLRQQNSYVKNKVGLVSIDDEAGKININDLIGNKWQALEWIYPMIVNMMENKTLNPGLEGVNRIVKDFTYFGDLTKPNFVDFGKLPPVVKQLVETGFNYDTFYDRELIPDYKKVEGAKTEEFNKYTNPLVVKLSRAMALITGGIPDEFGIITGGHQISPIILEKWLGIVDPMGTILDKTALILNNITNVGVTNSNIKGLNNLLHRTYNLQSNDIPKETDIKIKDDIFRVAHRGKINESLNNVKDLEELKTTGQNIVNQYKGNTFYESDYKKIIIDEIDKKEYMIKYGEKAYYDSQLSGKEYAVKLANILSDKGIQGVQAEIDVLKSRGTSREKIKNMLEELDKITLKYNIK